MSDPTIGKVDLEQIEAEEHREKIRNRILLAVILLIGIGVAFWVGAIVSSNQSETTKAQAQTEQAQVEKFNLAQQIAAACADPSSTSLDEDTYRRLCADARTIVREGPQGAQGIPGVQGPMGPQGTQGIQGVRGFDGNTGPIGPAGKNGKDGAEGPAGPAGQNGADGAEGPAGPPGQDGVDGAVGPQGPAGADGQPPFSWVVFNEGGQIVESCVRADPFDPKAPTYTCTRP